MENGLNLNIIRDELVNIISLFSVRPKEWLSTHIYSESHLSDSLNSTSFYWRNANGDTQHLFDYYHNLDNKPSKNSIKQIIPLISFQEN